MRDWPDLTARLELSLAFGDDIRPTDADLDAFESRFKIRLPDDYCHFVKVLGAGQINGISASNDMFAPVAPTLGEHPCADLAVLNSDHPFSPCCAAHIRTRDRLGRAWPEELDFLRRIGGLVFFFLAGTGEDQFAWQPAEVTDPTTGDMAIYLAQPTTFEVRRVAATFREFIVDYLLSGQYMRETFPDYADHRPAPDQVYHYEQFIYTFPDPQ